MKLLCFSVSLVILPLMSLIDVLSFAEASTGIYWVGVTLGALWLAEKATA